MLTPMIFPRNAFCFAELQTPAIEPAARFYGELFGWTMEPVGDGYWLFRLEGRDVVGVRRAPDHVWVPSLKVADADASAALLARHGASIVSPPVDVPGVSRACLIRDPEGATLQLWQPTGVEGTAVDAGPGSLWWIELATLDKDASAQYYASMFNWDLTHTGKFENGRHGYTLFKLNDKSTAGAFQPEPEWEMTPAWQIYFEVASFDATAAHACALGGEQGFWRDVPNAGRIGAIVDPGGASFLIAQPLVTGSA
jgi:predicted enzyme related to lactoylglutathione lyase